MFDLIGVGVGLRWVGWIEGSRDRGRRGEIRRRAVKKNNQKGEFNQAVDGEGILSDRSWVEVRVSSRIMCFLCDGFVIEVGDDEDDDGFLS